MNSRTFSAFTAAALVTAGCDRKPAVIVETVPSTPMRAPVARTATFETHALRKEIDAFGRTPSGVQAARVKKAFAEIDGEIAELVEHVARKTGGERAEAARKLADLRAYRDAEQVRFVRLEATAPLQERPTALEQPRRDGTAERVGEKIDEAAQKVEGGLREAADKIREQVR